MHHQTEDAIVSVIGPLTEEPLTTDYGEPRLLMTTSSYVNCTS